MRIKSDVIAMLSISIMIGVLCFLMTSDVFITLLSSISPACGYAISLLEEIKDEREDIHIGRRRKQNN
jgi:hypothetical protein